MATLSQKTTVCRCPSIKDARLCSQQFKFRVPALTGTCQPCTSSLRASKAYFKSMWKVHQKQLDFGLLCGTLRTLPSSEIRGLKDDVSRQREKKAINESPKLRPLNKEQINHQVMATLKDQVKAQVSGPIKFQVEKDSNPSFQKRPATGDELVVTQTEPEWTVQGVVRLIVSFLALRTVCEILGLQLVAELLKEPLTSLDPSTKANSMVFFAICECIGSCWLFATTSGTPTSTLKRLGLQTFQPGLVLGEGGWLLPALTGIGFLLIIPTTLFTTTYTTTSKGLASLEGVSQVLEHAFATGDSYSTSVHIVLVCMLSPILEELVFRGFFQSSLISLGMSSQPAIVCSALVFSLAHLSSRTFLPLFLLGVVLGSTYKSSNNLCTPLLVHVVYNFVVVVLGKALSELPLMT